MALTATNFTGSPMHVELEVIRQMGACPLENPKVSMNKSPTLMKEIWGLTTGCQELVTSLS